MKIKNNKKGAIDDFGGIVIAGLVMIAYTVIILVYVGYQEEVARSTPVEISNLGKAGFSTISVLEWELDSGMKLHEALVKYNDEKNLAKFAEELYGELEKQDLVPDQVWLLVIKSSKLEGLLVMDTSNEKKFSMVGVGSEKRNSFVLLPRISVPDGSNGIIEIITKQVSQADLDYYKSKERINRIGQTGVLGG